MDTQDEPLEIKELTKEDMKELPKEVIDGLIKSLEDLKAGRYTVSTNDIQDTKSIPKKPCNVCRNKTGKCQHQVY